jgi:hypothetical protein
MAIEVGEEGHLLLELGRGCEDAEGVAVGEALFFEFCVFGFGFPGDEVGFKSFGVEVEE